MFKIQSTNLFLHSNAKRKRTGYIMLQPNITHPVYYSWIEDTVNDTLIQ